MDTLVSKMTNLAEMSRSNDSLKGDVEKLETEKNNLKQTIVDIKQAYKDIKHDSYMTKATNTKLEEARRQHLQEFQNMVEVFEETQQKNVQLMSYLNILKAKINDKDEEVKIVYQTGDKESKVAENKIVEVADEETFTKLKTRGVKFDIVQQETDDEESNEMKDVTDRDFDNYVHEGKDGKTKIDKSFTLFEKSPASGKEFAPVTSTTGKALHVKQQYLQNIVSSKTAGPQASDVYQCRKCNQKFKSQLILQKHCKIVHGSFTHFVTIQP